MKLTKQRLFDLIEEEIANSFDYDAEITASDVERVCYVVIDWERETDPDLFYNFSINDKLFSSFAKKLN